MSMTKEEELIFKFANARPYGIYCDVEISPIDPEFCWDRKACQWDDVTSKDIDEIFEWIWEYHEDDEEKLEILKPFKELEKESKKWDFVDDLSVYHDDIIPDFVHFYYYIMERQLLGVCFTWNEALRLKESYDASLRPHIEILSRYDIKGYHELAEIAEYFKNKAKEIF